MKQNSLFYSFDKSVFTSLHFKTALLMLVSIEINILGFVHQIIENSIKIQLLYFPPETFSVELFQFFAFPNSNMFIGFSKKNFTVFFIICIRKKSTKCSPLGLLCLDKNISVLRKRHCKSELIG